MRCLRVKVASWIPPLKFAVNGPLKRQFLCRVGDLKSLGLTNLLSAWIMGSRSGSPLFAFPSPAAFCAMSNGPCACPRSVAVIPIDQAEVTGDLAKLAGKSLSPLRGFNYRSASSTNCARSPSRYENWVIRRESWFKPLNVSQFKQNRTVG